MSAGADSARAAAWREARSPSLDDLAALAEEAFARLPETFRTLCAGVVFSVEDWADDETLDALEIEDPLDLMGLYHGVDVGRRDQTVAGGVDRIVLYRRAILGYWAEHDEPLGGLVAHVVIHEIGHHIGLSDAQMAAIEAAAGPPS